MKHGKFLFLLAALLSVTLILASCNNGTGRDEAADTSASGQGKQNAVAHEMQSYLVLDDGEKPASYTGVLRFDGEIVDMDEEHHLIAVKTKDLDNYNMVIETITVYDTLTGDQIHQQSVSNLLYEGDERVELSLEIDYPIIRVVHESYSEGSAEGCTVSYYFAKKNSELLKSTNLKDYSIVNYENGLVSFTMGDELIWIDRNMEVVRTVDAVAANGYRVDAFNSEYQGYLYAWDDSKVQVFNKAGLCSAEYEIAHAGMLNVFVLDNGNVLIQDFELLESHEECDLYVGNYRMNMKSYVMNCVDGTVNAVELDYIVEHLATAYCDKFGDNSTAFPFYLAEGRCNQALIYRVGNGLISKHAEYVVLNNELAVEYTVKNDVEGVDFRSAYPISDTLYCASVNEGGLTQDYVFDLDGKALRAATWNCEVTDHYVVTDNAIYDHKMNLVYDLSMGEFADGLTEVVGNRIYLTKHNYATGCDELYRFDPEAKAPVLFNDGIETTYEGTFGGCYALWFIEDEKAAFYNEEGTPLLVTMDIVDVTEAEDFVVVQTTFEGKPVTYIVK